ncbi:MAG: acyl-CoA dehydrogenase family protein [Rhodocyclaceae bacterium]|nr:acyl-CoA dehydrogenase family protein [Rhodocyclaceae bacterium]
MSATVHSLSAVEATAGHTSNPVPARYGRNVPDSYGHNLFEADADLMPLLGLYLDSKLLAHLEPHLNRLGAMAGGRMETLAATADRETPKLIARTRTGVPTNDIDYHPAYQELERIGYAEFGLHAASHVPGVLGWNAPLPPLAKYVLFYLYGQVEHGLTCPLNMTDAFTRTLKKYGTPELIEKYLPKLTSLDMDELYQAGMFVTEQHAGSDVSQTETRACRAGNTWRLYGQKWFCSNASADVMLVLARPDDAPAGWAGVTLFLMPKIKADGSSNDYRIIALKDKICTKSMATGEIELEGAEAYRIGEVGRGFQQIAEMMQASRLSNSVRSAALMRRALTESRYFAKHRQAFGQPIESLPLMQVQLQKMELLVEQGRSFAFHTAEALRQADAGDKEMERLVRILTPLAKYRVCRDARKVAADAMEAHGGAGIIEEWPLARLMRDTFTMTIGEGTANVVSLDVYRCIQKQDATAVYRTHFEALANRVADVDLREKLLRRLQAIVPFVRECALEKRDHLARETASALYHLGSAIILAWEASQPGLGHRARLARSVLQHRLDPQYPRFFGKMVEDN